MTDLNTLLEAERTRLEVEQANLHDQIRRGTAQLEHVNNRLQHVRALLELERVPEDDEEDSQASSSQGSATPRTVCDIAVEILSERDGEPMYYKELAQEVLSRGGTLNGATPAATLTARMVRV